MNVLVVDDQRVMREISKAIITQMGHCVQEAENGHDAIYKVQHEKIDLVLLDVEMPGINGFETAQQMRSNTPTWFPILFLSARVESDFFVEGIKSGGDAYLYKPIVPEVLEAMIRAMSRIISSQEALHSAKIQMELLAHRDSLTGLVNRRGFDNAIELELDKAKADKSPLTIMMIDVDHFKLYNDNYGHQAGDQCLQQVAQLLKKTMCRDRDIVARYGGEEFVVLLPNTSASDATIVAQRIVDTMTAAAIPHEYSSAAPHVTVSGGIAQFALHKNPQALIKDADKQLYRAKESGRNQIL